MLTHHLRLFTRSETLIGQFGVLYTVMYVRMRDEEQQDPWAANSTSRTNRAGLISSLNMAKRRSDYRVHLRCGLGVNVTTVIAAAVGEKFHSAILSLIALSHDARENKPSKHPCA